MQRKHSDKPWCRYADDGLVHCKTKHQAIALLADLKLRFNACGLVLHPDKTKVAYCQDSNRREVHSVKSFDFLGYTFRPRKVKNSNTRNYFVSFCPAISKGSAKSLRDKTRSFKWHLRSGSSLEDIANEFNPILRGWFNYYGKYQPSAVFRIWRHFNRVLVKWARRKYKRLK